MANLHELLAVKKDASQRANEVAGESRKIFAAKHYFNGSVKTYQPFDDEDNTQFPDEREELGYTAGEKMRWFAQEFGRILDIEYQIDLTNDAAMADLTFGGKTIPNVPATFLLDLITKLEKVRKTYAALPVLDPKYQWERDPDKGDGVFETRDPEITYRARKVLKSRILAPATDKHPAQVKDWAEDAQVGKYTKRIWSGALTAAQKASVLGRIDELTTAAKKALSKANNAEHSKETIAEDVFSFIHGNVPLEGIYREEE